MGALAAYPGKPLALKRCIGNLLDNALKYGERALPRRGWQGGAGAAHVDDEGRCSGAAHGAPNPMYGSPASSSYGRGWVSRATSLTPTAAS